MKYFVFSLLLVFLFSPFSFINAQQIGVTKDDINIELIPDSPGPYTIVSVLLTSFSIDVNSTTITWMLDGVKKSSSRGQKNFSFTTGNYGETSSLRVVVETINGEVIDKTLKIKPADVDLVWESEGYTPPFYKGKSDFSFQNMLTFIAVPHITGSNGVETSPKNLIYKWKKNGSVIEDASGYGKNSYSVKGSVIARPIDVSVEVTNLSADTKAIGSLFVTPKDPLVLLYEKNPFYGKQVPNSPELIYKWSINGKVVNDNQSETIEIFRQKEGTSGTSNISLSIENTDEILQLAKNIFQINFGEKTNEQTQF